MSAAGLLQLLVGAVDAPLDMPLWLRLGLIGSAMALCLAISIIDARHRIIPDSLNAVLAGLGLVSAGLSGADAASAAIVQGTVSFGLFWAFRTLYRLVRGVQGLGFGDVKFLGAAGIWVGLGGIAPLILVACCGALGCVALARLRGRVITGRTALPFGPFLAFGLAAVLAVNIAWPPGS